MASPFPPAAAPDDPATAPRRSRPTARSEQQPRRGPVAAVAIVLLVAGAALLWLVTGTVAGVDTDAIGVAAITLGGIALIARLVALRRSHHRHGLSVP